MPNVVVTPEQRAALLTALQSRFDKNRSRHPTLKWALLSAALEAQPEKLWALHEMERTGGEPDVICRDARTGEYRFVDWAPESPVGRRSMCYDLAGQDSRKDDVQAKGNAVRAAAAMGIELLTEEEYVELQTLGEFDQNTSRWLQTPAAVRRLGGAIFGDRRYGRLIVCHNGAQSFYGARGFRGVMRVRA